MSIEISDCFKLRDAPPVVLEVNLHATCNAFGGTIAERTFEIGGPVFGPRTCPFILPISFFKLIATVLEHIPVDTDKLLVRRLI